MEEKCEYCDKMKEWNEGKVRISIEADLCRKCVEKMLLVQISALAHVIKELLSFQKELSKKHSSWLEKTFGWMKKTEDETNEGEEWKKK